MSKDSRFPELGFVPRDRIVGPAMTVTDSTDLPAGEWSLACTAEKLLKLAAARA